MSFIWCIRMLTVKALILRIMPLLSTLVMPGQTSVIGHIRWWLLLLSLLANHSYQYLEAFINTFEDFPLLEPTPPQVEPDLWTFDNIYFHAESFLWDSSSRPIGSKTILSLLSWPFVPKHWGVSRGNISTLQHSSGNRDVIGEMYRVTTITLLTVTCCVAPFG